MESGVNGQEEWATEGELNGCGLVGKTEQALRYQRWRNVYMRVKVGTLCQAGWYRRKGLFRSCPSSGMGAFIFCKKENDYE